MDKKETFEEWKERKQKEIDEERPILSDKFTYKVEGELIIYQPRNKD